MKHDHNSPVLEYIRHLYAPEDAVLTAIREEFVRREMPIQVGAEEGKLLQVLLKLHKAKTVVEIGTLGGYSAIWMARALPSNGHLHTIEYNPEHAEIARKYIHRAGLQDKITVWQGMARDVLPRVGETIETCDALFIDADKINYPHYLDWAESNVRQGGLIIGDNTLLFGTVYLDAPPPMDEDQMVRQSTWEAMRNFNARLGDPKHFDGVMIATEQGLSVAIKK